MRRISPIGLIGVIGLMGLMACARGPAAPEPPVPWAWERAEDLRFVGERQAVAFYAGIITLDGERVRVEPRRNPLLLAPDAHRVATIRIETRRAALTASQREETVAAIRRLFRNAEELQLDFDATRSERAFYRELLTDVRRQVDAPLTITALASWCFGDRWLGGLPIDGAVPMLFRMGTDEPAIRTRLAAGKDFPEPRCRASAGIALDETTPPLPPGTRIWIFNPRPWNTTSWATATQLASRR